MSNEGVVDNDGIVIIDSDEGFLSDAMALFEGRVATAGHPSEIASRVDAGDVDVVFLGPSFADEAGLARADALIEADPDLTMVLVAPPNVGNDVLRSAIKIGLRDVVESPLSAAVVNETLASAERSSRRRNERPPVEPPSVGREGKIVTVMAAKGGSGKTVVASNVATILARTGDPSRVVIADGNLQFGDVALVLQVDPKHTVVNAAKEGASLDEAFLDKVLATHSSGMRVLAAPLEPAFADEVPTATYTRILTMLRGMFDYVVVDTAPALDERLLSILERSDQVLFIVDMDLPSVKNAKLALETLRILNYPANKIDLVLNRSNSKARLDVAEIERSLRVQISASIPSDGLVPASINEGVPISVAHPKSKPAKAFEEVAALVSEGRPAAQTQDASRKRRWR